MTLPVRVCVFPAPAVVTGERYISKPKGITYDGKLALPKTAKRRIDF
jgi:hypothetical protein